MDTVNDQRPAEMTWVQSKQIKRGYELRSQETTVATLTLTGRSQATGEWAEQRYHFSRVGWFRRRVEARAGDEAIGEPLATFAQNRGALSFPDGRVLAWRKPRRWTNERAWVDAAGEVLIRFQPSRRATDVTFGQAAAALPDAALLILLGQFILVLEAADTQAAITAATVTAVTR